MSDNEAEVDVSFLPSGQGGTGKRAVYEPDGAQRCKQVVCSRNWAIAIVTIFCLLVVTVAVIAAFARPTPKLLCGEQATPPTPTQTVAPTEAVATNGEAFPWKDIRLPRSVIPIKYDIEMHPNLTTFQFSGRVTIDLKIRSATDFIVLHTKRLNLTSFEMSHYQSPKKVPISRTLYFPAHEQVYIELNQELVTTDQYTLVLQFNGILSDLMAGFYRSSYKTSLGETRFLAVTQFEPTDARAAFPCFDEPNMKATFTMSIIRQAQHTSLFNMPLVDTEDYGADLKMDRFETSVKMSTYLVAFVVCDFSYIQNTTARGTLVSVYAPREQLDQAEFALNAAVTILEYYEQFFGIPYPLPKQDLIAIPDFAPGAMENWGLVTYRMAALLYDPKVSTGRDQQRVAVIVAHELAHQWFGNLVTMEWWNDLWLNEGFASFVEYIGADRVRPDWLIMDQFVVDSVADALYQDSLTNSHPISMPVKDPGEINEIFDSISYHKGASIIRMLEGFIGRDKLQQALQYYLKKYQYSNAKTENLWTAVEDTVGYNIDIKGIMNTWTLQMGYPIVMVSRRGGSMQATQTQFLLNRLAHNDVPSPYDYKWQIPFTFITSQTPPGQKNDPVWIKDQPVNFKVPQDIEWFKVNVNFTGYYRVFYDENNWKALITQLKVDHTVFSAADRAELLDDVFALARASYMSATTAFDLALYLEKEEEYVPWAVVFDNIADMATLLEMDPDCYEDFRMYMLRIISPFLNTYGWSNVDSYPRRQLQSKLLKAAVLFNHEKTANVALEMYHEWMNNGTLVSPEWKVPVYQAGIQYGGPKEWNFMWEQYKTTNVPTEKRHLLVSLGSTTDSNQLLRYLHMTLDETKVRKQDTVTIITEVAQTAPGRILAWNFLKQNWEEFVRRYGDSAFEFSSLIKGVLGGFTTQYDFEDAQSFFKAHEVSAAKRAVAQVLERVEMNVDWLTKYKTQVCGWLSEHTVEISQPNEEVEEEEEKEEEEEVVPEETV